MSSETLVRIENLQVDFRSQSNASTSVIHAVKGVSFDIPKGKTIGVVGESGSGKSVTALSILKLIPSPPGQIVGGSIQYQGQDLLKMSDREIKKIRGNKISMIFQDPMSSLNPVFRVGSQIAEALRIHQGLSRKKALAQSIQLLGDVGIPNPEERVNSYPHELSGGQRQRVMIAMAIACRPDLLIADEPTTALDVTIQKQILELLRNLQKQYGMSLMFISHDLAVIAEICDEVVVMYRGQVVEKGATQKIFSSPLHPYTKALLKCRPSLQKRPVRLPLVSDFMDEAGNELQFQVQEGSRALKSNAGQALLEVRDLVRRFPLKKGWFGQTLEELTAVNKVSFNLNKGQTLGLVGESGCGKSTLGRCLLRLIEPNEGEIHFDGKNVRQLPSAELRSLRKRMQIIFQDPFSSLNPRLSIWESLSEPLEIHKIGSSKSERLEIAADLMVKVGLEPKMMSRYPHEFSGGQVQRVCIARALAVQPDFIICDESVSALDVSVQAQILNLLLDLQDQLGLTYVFISHDLAVVKFISDQIAVMEKGQIVEMASADSIYSQPQHPYTRKLMAAIPQGL